MTQVQQLEMKVLDNGIHCDACEARIQNVLGRLPGVLRVRADHRTQKVSVAIDLGRLSPQEVRQRLVAIGFATEEDGDGDDGAT
ncbi:MAG: heavy-metal-associated domain-containing protein [Chloroflexi bacterium]|nr:heavy-metal-associated domain-containing protein [Chloroflexota bacterium]